MKKALKFILGLILILLIGIYFFGAYFYRSYFLPKTIVNGKDLSLTMVFGKIIKLILFLEMVRKI